ncbi:hypothetical protein Acr_18g0000900 [Actinidia rufa]|uniref:Uncharacterized protein n=1 Tax=Actinidia rufa TaxID=165716 RepID=A0A7J0G554_9ERIC|nr:hypothetical protein Acr_18g0000900 [Actinidia rufa]
MKEDASNPVEKLSRFSTIEIREVVSSCRWKEGGALDKAVRLSKEEFVLGSEAEGSSQGKGNHQFKRKAIKVKGGSRFSCGMSRRTTSAQNIHFTFASIASRAGSESGAHVHQRRRSRPVDRSWNVFDKSSCRKLTRGSTFYIGGQTRVWGA